MCLKIIVAVVCGGLLCQSLGAQSNKKVLLERPVIFSDEKGQNQFVSYRDRRSPFGFHVGVLYSFYAPVYYDSEYLGPTADNESGLFGEPKWRLFEALAAARWNSALGSLSLEARGGFLRDSVELVNSNNGVAPLVALGFEPLQDTPDPDPDPDPDPPNDPAPTPTPAPKQSNIIDLQLITTSLGVKWSLDSITREPWAVPFLSAGAFMVFYTENRGDDESAWGRSGVGFYYSGGLVLQLDWLDKEASVDFYLDSGIENTFLICEARQFISFNNTIGVKNFASPVHFNIGLLVEF